MSEIIEINPIVSETKIIETAPVALNSGADMYRSLYDSNFDGVVDTCEYIDCGTF